MKNQDNDISVPIKMKVPSQGGEGGEGGHGWPMGFVSDIGLSGLGLSPQ